MSVVTYLGYKVTTQRLVPNKKLARRAGKLLGWAPANVKFFQVMNPRGKLSCWLQRVLVKLRCLMADQNVRAMNRQRPLRRNLRKHTPRLSCVTLLVEHSGNEIQKHTLRALVLDMLNPLMISIMCST